MQTIGHHKIRSLKTQIIPCYLIESALGDGYRWSFTFHKKKQTTIWFENDDIIAFEGVVEF